MGDDAALLPDASAADVLPGDTFEVALPRRRLRYRDVGPRDARSRVVLLHGLGHGAAHWSEVADHLAGAHRTVAPELHGDATLRDMAESIVDLVAALDLGRVTLVGHDVGAAAALVVATEWPEFVERIALVSPPILPRKPLLEERAAMLPVVGRALFRRGLGRFLLRRRGASQVDDGTLPLLRETTDRASLFARLPRVRCPAMLVFGRGDRVEPWTSGARLARELAGARLEVLEGGHCPAEEDAPRLATLLDGFVREGRR